VLGYRARDSSAALATWASPSKLACWGAAGRQPIQRLSTLPVPFGRAPDRGIHGRCEAGPRGAEGGDMGAVGGTLATHRLGLALAFILTCVFGWKSRMDRRTQTIARTYGLRCAPRRRDCAGMQVAAELLGEGRPFAFQLVCRAWGGHWQWLGQWPEARLWCGDAQDRTAAGGWA
jgi:hypothetical protein